MKRSAVFEIQQLEPRMLLAVSPASVLTKPMRQELLNNLSINIKSSLQSKLTANDLTGFDQQLLTYFVNRTASHFFFDPGDVANIVTYHNTELNPADVFARADKALAGNGTDASDPDSASVRHDHWTDLGMAYRLNGNGAYADKLIDEFAQWSADNPPLADPNTWRDAAPDWQRLPTSIHGDTWSWAYALMIGTAKWTKETNTLFLKKILEHGQFLYEVDSMELVSNQALIQGQGLLYIGQYFPEFTAAGTWETAGRELLFNSMDAQFYDDGSHYEQSPNYAAAVIQRLLETRKLDSLNGATWDASRSQRLSNAVEALYQFLSPDGKTPAIGDTYRNSLAYYFLKANLIQGTNDWPAGRPRARDLWLLGPTAVDPYKNNAPDVGLDDRGKTYPLEDSGNYILRSGADSSARQIIFDTGPQGGGHGHADLLNFELFGYGRPLIADPGLYKYDSSSKRAWVLSTPAHNTVSIDNKNIGQLEGSTNPGIVLDSYNEQAGFVQVTAHHWGYAQLTGRPVVTRSLWYDYDSTMVIVDWVEGVESHKAQTSFLLPVTSDLTSRNLAQGWIQTKNPTGGNVKVQSLLQTGQASTFKTENIFYSNTASNNPAATQFFTYQTGSFVAFVTLITAYDGLTAPNTTAQLLSAPAAGVPVQVRLTKSGVDQDITFTPPKLTYPNANGQTNGTYSDLTYDKNGRLHLVYFDRDNKILKYTVRSTNGKWAPVETIDDGFLRGYNPRIALDSKGRVGIAYTDANHGDLIYASNVRGYWEIQKVDVPGSTGHYPSIAFARFDLPFISYYDNTKGALKLATLDEGKWKIRTIDSGDIGKKDVGRYSDIVLDPSRPTSTKWGIVYEDTGGGRYLYAIQGNIRNGVQKNDYTIFEVAKAPKLGGWTSLVYDTQNRPTVNYYDSSITGLKFAQSEGDTFGTIRFTAQTVAEKGAVGYYANMYYAGGTTPTILYFNRDKSKAMKAVRGSNNKWNVTELVAGGRELHAAQFNGTVAYTNLNEAKRTLEVLSI